MNKRIFSNFILLTKYNLGTLILFELFHKGIALIFVLPIIKYVFEGAMHNVGIIYLSTDNPFLVSDAIYWKKNDFVNIVANYLF